VAAVNALRTRYGYVFITGGIGPTHDDITADAIAKAFNVSIEAIIRYLTVTMPRPHFLSPESAREGINAR
jgi:molybdopterin-biosynthesis enzyme MoeA-like protein